MKIIKYSLLAACGAFLLPSPPAEHFAVMQGGTRINLETGEGLSAAALTFSDVTGFCQRQPDVCNTAGQMFTSLEMRAKYNFQRLYEWSKSSPSSQSAPKPPALNIKTEQSARLDLDQIITGSIKTRSGKIAGYKTFKPLLMAKAKQAPSVNTLNIEDLVPEWRGPARTSTG